MRFTPSVPERGDMVRVRLGSVYHYGICSGPDRVIQFGYPPVPQYASEDKVVLETGSDVFCCGMIPEVARPEGKEKKNFFPKERAALNAESRLGEGGYDLIYNNCEHFAYECATGKAYCSAVEDARKRWASRPLFDVYFADISDPSMKREFHSEKRMKYIASAVEDTLYKRRCASWTLVEYALKKSLGVDPSGVGFKRRSDGKWLSKGFYISISYAKTEAAVALSSAECGIDIAFDDGGTPQADIRCPGEEGGFTELYTKKESIYKCFKKGRFLPLKIRAADYPVYSFTPFEDGMICSVCGEHSSKLRIYRFADGTASPVFDSGEKKC